MNIFDIYHLELEWAISKIQMIMRNMLDQPKATQELLSN